MTQRDYIVIQSIIDKYVVNEYITPHYVKKYIPANKLQEMKEEIYKLVGGK